MNKLTAHHIDILNAVGLYDHEHNKIVSDLAEIAEAFEALLQRSSDEAHTCNHESRDSIEVSRNAKDDYAWKIKAYGDLAVETIAMLDLVDEIDEDMRARYLKREEYLERGDTA